MSPFDIRVALRANGYSPIPVQGKKPALADWPQMHDAEPGQIEQWDKVFPRARNTGILTRLVATFDGDIRHPEAAEAISEAVSDWIGDGGVLLTRFGNAPKRAHLFRVEEPFKKYYRDFRHPNDKPGDKPHRLEFLCDGQQVVAFGIHPETNAEYRWHADRSPLTTKRADLPGTNSEDARRLIDHCADILIQQFDFVEVNKQPTTNNSYGDGNSNEEDYIKGDPIGALKNMRPGDVAASDLQKRVAASMVRRGYHPDEIQQTIVDITLEVNAKDNPQWTREYEDREVYGRLEWALRQRCDEFNPGIDTAIPDWLHKDFHDEWLRLVNEGQQPKFAKRCSGWYVRRSKNGTSAAAAETGEQTNDTAPVANQAPDAKQGAFKKRVLKLDWFKSFDVEKHPCRAWLFGKHYQRQTVSLTAGPGGMGKSSLDLVEGISMATCRNLLGEQPNERLRVWFHNGDDPLEETLRRVAAICQHYSIPQEELEQHLCITSGNEFPLRVARGYTNLEIDTSLVKQISDAINEKEIDLAIFDPLVTMHSVSEMDTGKMDAVIRLFAGIADEYNCGIEVAHHVRKPAPGAAADYDVHDIRGVQAITDAVRAARVLNRMNPRDAEAAGCDETQRLLRFRVDRAKGNYSPAEVATWRQLVSVEIANGDAVGVVAPWDFPGHGSPSPEKTAADRKADEVFLHLLDKFNSRGLDVSPKIGPNYAPARFADEREAKGAKVSKAALKAAMNRLLDAGRVLPESIGRSDRSTQRLVIRQESPNTGK